MEENQSKLLINLVKSFPELYDDKNEQYKHNDARENAWKAIAARLNCTPDFCQNAWVGMQEEYIKEKKKLHVLPSGSDMKMRSKWPWYNDMEFLDCNIQTLRTTSTASSHSCLPSKMLEESEEDDKADSNNVVPDPPDSENDEAEDTFTRLDEQPATCSKNNEEDESYTSNDEENSADTTTDEEDETMSEREDEYGQSESETELYETMCDFANQMLKTVTTYVKPEATVEDLFGKLVASKLASIQDPVKRLEKEQAISNALFKR